MPSLHHAALAIFLKDKFSRVAFIAEKYIANRAELLQHGRPLFVGVAARFSISLRFSNSSRSLFNSAFFIEVIAEKIKQIHLFHTTLSFQE